MISNNLKKDILRRYTKSPWIVFVSLIFILLVQACSSVTHQVSRDGDAAILKTSVPSKKDPIQDAYTNFTMASLAISHGDYDQAGAYLLTAIEKDPESLYLLSKMAMLLKRMKKFPEALSYALKCVELSPEDMPYRIMLADLYTLNGKDDLASEQYNTALSLDPENERIRLLVATILIRKNQLPEALVHLEKLIEQNPESVIAYYYIGKVNAGLKHYGKAEIAFLEVLKLKEGQESAMIDLGALYQKTGRPEDAVEIYKKLLEFYPNNIGVRIRLANLYTRLGFEDQASLQMQEIKERAKPGDPGRQTLGLIYLRQGKLDEAIEELNLIISVWPEDKKTIYYLAVAYQEKGELDKSLAYFSQIEKDSKYFPDSQMHMAFILDSQEKHDQAKKILEKAIAVNKSNAELYLMLSSIYENLEAYDAAMKVIKEGLQQNDKNIDLIFRLGVLLDKSGDKQACLDEMKKVLEINPNHADSLNYVGYTYAEQGVKLDEALELIKKALEIQPDSGYIIDSLGWIYFQKGLYDEAIIHLEKSVQLTPEDPTINEHLGDAYFRIRNYEKALHYFNKALSNEHPREDKLKEKIVATQRILNKSE